MALKSLSTADLQAELARREKGLAKLQARREVLLNELAGIDTEIVSLGGQGSGRATGRRLSQSASSNGAKVAKGDSDGRRRRAKNPVSLPEAVADAMEVGAVVSPKEAAEYVLKNGYKTHSKSFNMQVSNVLAKDPRFKRLERGQYERVK